MTQLTHKEKELIGLVQKGIAYVDLSSLVKSSSSQKFVSIYSNPGELSGGNEFLGIVREKFTPFRRVLRKECLNLINERAGIKWGIKNMPELVTGEIYQVTLWGPYGSKAVLRGELESFESRRNPEKGKSIGKVVLKNGIHVRGYDLSSYFESEEFHPLSDLDVERVIDKELFLRMRDSAAAGNYII